MFSDPEKNIEQFSLGAGNYVADFGCGSGFYSFAAAEVVGQTGKVYAIDVQKSLLEKLKKEARETRHLSNLDVVWGDLEHLGGTRLRENSLDAVIASNVFFQFEDRDNPCMEMRRILKRGGRVLVIDYSSPLAGGGQTQNPVFSPDEARKLFKKHGFVEDREIFPGGQSYGIIFRKE